MEEQTTVVKPASELSSTLTLCIAQFSLTLTQLKRLKIRDLLIPSQSWLLPTITIYEGMRLIGSGEIGYISHTGYVIRITQLF